MKELVDKYYIEPEMMTVSSAQFEAKERMADDDLGKYGLRPYWEWRAIALARLGAHLLVPRSAIDRTPYLSKQGLKSCIPL